MIIHPNKVQSGATIAKNYACEKAQEYPKTTAALVATPVCYVLAKKTWKQQKHSYNLQIISQMLVMLWQLMIDYVAYMHEIFNYKVFPLKDSGKEHTYSLGILYCSCNKLILYNIAIIKGLVEPFVLNFIHLFYK